MPLGLGYIAAVLEKNGYEVQILDAYIKSLPYSKVSDYIINYQPDVIGITCLSDQRASCFELIDLIRSLNSKIKIVLGGAHASLMTEQVLMNKKPDAIVIGEGELTMLELINAWDSGEDLNSVKGIAYLLDNKSVFTGPRNRIRNLDDLPFPSRHLISLDDYLGWDFMDFLSKRLGLQKSPRYATILTSRGCLGGCGYCSSPLIWKGGWICRSAVNIADEFEFLVEHYRVDFVIITDDIFTINQRRVFGLCTELKRRNINVLWGFETAVNYVSEDLLLELKRAGCCCILYGVESGSSEVLSKINKHIKEEQILRAFHMTKKAGILAGAFLMIGNPSENEKSINETIALLKKIKPDILLPQIAMITPRTYLYEEAKKKGVINDEFWLTDAPFPYYTAERRLETLLRWYRKIMNYDSGWINIKVKTIADYIEIKMGMS